MKYLIGYRPSEMDVNRDILPYILASEEIQGVEVYFSEEEATRWQDYHMDMARQLRNHGKLYQVHLPELNSKNIHLLSRLKPMIDLYGSINAVIHHAMGCDIEEDIQLTFEMLDLIFDYLQIQDLNIVIHLENLNMIRSLAIFPEEDHDRWRHIIGRQRINIDLIDEILIRYPELKFCLDIGHVISDKMSFNLSVLQKQRIGNIHIHDADEQADHQRNGTCTDILWTDACVKSVFNIAHFNGVGVIEVAKSNLDDNMAKAIAILEKEIKLMKGKHYTEVTLVDGQVLPRDKAIEACERCGSDVGEMHQSYCECEICPLCGKYLSECHHMEGYTLDAVESCVVTKEVSA